MPASGMHTDLARSGHITWCSATRNLTIDPPDLNLISGSGLKREVPREECFLFGKPLHECTSFLLAWDTYKLVNPHRQNMRRAFFIDLQKRANASFGAFVRCLIESVTKTPTSSVGLKQARYLH